MSPRDPADRSRPFRVVEQHEPPAVEAPPPNLRAGILDKLIASVPPWGRVVIGTALALGLGTGAGIGGMAKVLGVQTVAQAAADKTELKASIEAVRVGQEAAFQVALRKDADIAKALEEVKAAQSRQSARIEQVRSLIKRRVTASEATP